MWKLMWMKKLKSGMNLIILLIQKITLPIPINEGVEDHHFGWKTMKVEKDLHTKMLILI